MIFETRVPNFCVFFFNENTLKPVTTCTFCTQKSLKFILFYHGLSWNFFPSHIRPQNFGQKYQKMTICKANPRLVKSSYCPKIRLTYNIWSFICKKMSKTWPLLAFVSLKYCTEKRLLKTHVAFSMKVTVYRKERRSVKVFRL
jgi:hypothetical protein